MTTQCCVCFISDDKLLFPTLLSAIQARANVTQGLADIIIFAVEPSARASRDFAAVCASEDIQFRSIARSTVGGATGMYSRLFLDRFVPDSYDQLLYLDGDVQILHSLDPLIRTIVPAGQFLAARDPMVFSVHEPGAAGEHLRHYMHNLGLLEAQFKDYFNSGVLRINRHGWKEIGTNAYEFLLREDGACQWHDQSALNAVSAGQHKLISFRWNFPIFFRNCGVERQIKPVIHHFMSNPKPWHGNFPPWTADSVLPYRDLITKHQRLAEYVPRLPTWKTGKYFIQQRGKKVSEFFGWRLNDRRSRIIAADHTAAAL